MDLFAAAADPHTLVDDAEGGIRYWPALVAPALADGWFQQLRGQVSWQVQQRSMYDRVVAVPRLLASFRLDTGTPPSLPLAAMLQQVQAYAPAPYNTAGLNLYRDGRDSVAMHHDKLHTLLPGQPIALLSLGATRRMNIRAREGGGTQSVALEPGSLLMMSHASQLSHLHGIPKTARAVGERISVVFRVRPQARMEAGLYGTHWQGAVS